MEPRMPQKLLLLLLLLLLPLLLPPLLTWKLKLMLLPLRRRPGACL